MLASLEDLFVFVEDLFVFVEELFVSLESLVVIEFNPHFLLLSVNVCCPILPSLGQRSRIAMNRRSPLR